jgi:ubiquinone biosynthesis protein
MRQRMLRTATSGRAFASALELRELVERLPARVNRVLESLADNQVRFKVEVIDQGAIIEGLQKVANRIALGLVLAALIIGAAMMMRISTSFTILGYPGIAILLFFAAVSGGAWIVWHILVDDARRTRVR